ncbi:MAG: autotransporter-associated beta strand repeat-containing protein [Bosea sp. (in: a-proteobacteria)]
MLACASLRRSTALTGGVLAALLTVLPSPQPLHAQNVTITTPQRGADGAPGSASSPFSPADSGGNGVTGYQYSQSGTVTVDATVTGGAGGNGGVGGSSVVGNGGAGGFGGIGLSLSGGQGAQFNAAISGGAGGPGGVSLGERGGAGGEGGAGLRFANGGTATINAAVTGGTGGAGGASGAGSPGAGGAGGAGITGFGLTLTLGSNATIAGGLSGDGLARANALAFTGGANILSIEAGARLTGNISLGTNTTTLQFAQTNDYTLSNVISGAGAVSKTGAGTLYLTGANTYTGGTRIDNGALIIGDGGRSGSIVGDVVNNTALAFYRSDDTSFAGAISGMGVVHKAGAGSLTLSGTNTYAGGTKIREGTIKVSTDANLGAASGILTLDGGTLAATGSFNSARSVELGDGGGTIDTVDPTALTLSGMVAGAGRLAKTGFGLLTLTGANTYSGGTTITAGTLQIGNGGTSGSINGDVTNNATLAFNRSDDTVFAGAISGSGSVRKSGAGTLTLTGANTYSGGTSISAGTLQIGDGGTSGSLTGDVGNLGVLAFDRSDASVFAGKISGRGSVRKSGAGTLTLTGVSTYSGATTVSSGRLAVNGSIASSSVAVNAEGTLGGSGTVGHVTVAGGGTLAPGNSIGTLSVAGNLAFTAGSTYAVEVSPSASDRVDVTGTATLGGARVAASFAPGAYVAKQYAILTATGGVVGAFGPKVDTNLPSGFSASSTSWPRATW